MVGVGRPDGWFGPTGWDCVVGIGRSELVGRLGLVGIGAFGIVTCLGRGAVGRGLGGARGWSDPELPSWGFRGSGFVGSGWVGRGGIRVGVDWFRLGLGPVSRPVTFRLVSGLFSLFAVLLGVRASVSVEVGVSCNWLVS